MSDPLKSCYEKLIDINNDVYESILERLYCYVLSQGQYAVDVGAHVGRHTFPMAKAAGPSGAVFAFEPLPHLYGKLAYAVGENSGLNISLFQLALSRENGTLQFLHIEDAPGLSGLMPRTSHDGHKVSQIKVDVRRLDDVIPSDKPIKFMKIDAEGADFYILQGAQRILTADRPLVVFESGRINAFPAKSYGYTEIEFNQFFDEHGYVLYDIAGFKYQPRFWDQPTLNDFVAIPQEREHEYREILLAAVLSEFVRQAS